MIEIKNRYTGEVIFTYEGDSLVGAYLYGADFNGANFNGADFTEADLTGATLLGHKVTKAPLQISGLTWPVLITEQVMAIGCQTHTHEQWAAFPDKEISNMHSHALKFWKEHGPILLQLCRVHAK
mgnify:CR=1 FL=1